MRRQWYTGFGIALIAVFLFLVMLHDARWFLVVIIPLIILWVYDMTQTEHTLLRNFPILAHSRYLLEFIRPEIQQYFIANNEDERPFSRDRRSVVYQRSKNVRDTTPFGTERDIKKVGYTWVLHSMAPRRASEVEARVMVGGPDCLQPYSASLLNISAMSFGSLSAKALMALNQAAQAGGFAHNTGEGGLSPYHLQGGDVVFQIGTAYFGCRDDQGLFDPEEFRGVASHPSVKMIELKLSQGAKPSHGGILPAAKLTEEIARVRKVPMGQDVISPAAHSAFSTPLGLLEFVKTLRELSGGKPVGFKLCLGRRHEFLGICKAMLDTRILPDFITVDGAEGGTGAAPFEFSNRVGEALEPGLVFIHNALIGINVRDKIRLIASGKIVTGFDMVEKIALGADMCNSARGMMLAVGCVQSKQCNANTCPTGVATQNKRLQRGLVIADKKVRAANFHRNTLKSFMELIGAMGLVSPGDLTPDYLMRRVSESSIKPLSLLYERLEPGQLIQGDVPIPESYKRHWEKASAEHF